MGAYAGQALTTGAQAKTYADHFIAVHLAEMGKGGLLPAVRRRAGPPKNTGWPAWCRPYSAAPRSARCLLEAYGFWMFGQIALFAAIASFIGAGLMFILWIAGLVHRRRVPAETEVLAKSVHTSTVTA